MKTLTLFPVKKLSLACCAASLIACGGTGQDDGTPSTYSQTYSGLVIDGYIARATVFLDTNNDGTRNAWEPFAFTDDEGYYSYNPNTETDYCASTATAEQAQYCLRTSTEHQNVVVRVDSGYDILTGEPFAGQLSRRLDAGDSTQNNLITPLTTIVTNVQNSSDRNQLLNSVGVVESDLNVNYLNTDGNGEINEHLLNTSLKIHKVVTVLSDRLTDTYTEIGDEVGTPNDATQQVYNQLANSMLNTNQTLDQTIQDNNALAQVLDNAESSLRSIYQRKEFTLPQDLGDTENSGNFSRVIQVSQGISNVIDSVVPTNGNIQDNSEARGNVRAIESVVIKAINETNNDSSIDNAVNFFTNSNNSNLINSLTQSLSGDRGDLVSLANNDFSGDDFDSEEEVTSASTLPDDATPFSYIAGMQIRVSDLDLGSSPNNLKDSEVEVYFKGETTDLSGAFTACAKYIDGANIDGSLGEGNSRGEIVDGYWSLLGADQINTESYSLLLTITFLGTTYQAIMKPSGTAIIDNTEYHKVRFDNDGEVSTWHSELGLISTDSIPTSNADCESRLPSRVGL